MRKRGINNGLPTPPPAQMPPHELAGPLQCKAGKLSFSLITPHQFLLHQPCQLFSVSQTAPPSFGPKFTKGQDTTTTPRGHRQNIQTGRDPRKNGLDTACPAVAGGACIPARFALPHAAHSPGWPIANTVSPARRRDWNPPRHERQRAHLLCRRHGGYCGRQGGGGEDEGSRWAGGRGGSRGAGRGRERGGARGTQ